MTFASTVKTCVSNGYGITAEESEPLVSSTGWQMVRVTTGKKVDGEGELDVVDCAELQV